MLENIDIILKNGETCNSKFAAVLTGKTSEQENDDGIVYITNRRLIFKGKKSLACSIAKILTYDSTPSKLSLHMENGNLITFETKHTYAPSVISHIASIGKSTDEEDISSIMSIREWNEEIEKSRHKTTQENNDARRTKSAKKRRKKRKQKIAEDLFVTFASLIVIAILYFYFHN